MTWCCCPGLPDRFGWQVALSQILTDSAGDLPAPSRVIFLRGLLAACHKSYWACIPVHSSGLVPRASDRRNAISAEIPELPFSRRDSATRVTCKCLAASVTDTDPRYSRKTLPGWGGLCIRMVNTSVIILVVHQHGVFTVKRKSQTPVAADIDQYPSKSPCKGCSLQPGAFMSFGALALSSAKSCRRSLSACFGWMPAFRASLAKPLYAPVPKAPYHHV
jgi:hypothetical protein